MVRKNLRPVILAEMSLHITECVLLRHFQRRAISIVRVHNIKGNTHLLEQICCIDVLIP